MDNSWRPDWKDSGKYPEAQNTSLKQWAWEFLRRNEDYQRDFKWALSQIKDFDSGKGILFANLLNVITAAETEQDALYRRYEQVKLKALESYSLINFIDPAKDYDPYWESRNYTQQELASFAPLMDAETLAGLKQKGLSGVKIFDLENLPDYREFTEHHRGKIEEINGKSKLVFDAYILRPMRPGQVVVRFNLNYSISAQLEIIKKELKQLQNVRQQQGVIKVRSKKDVTSVYPKYLRILDALAQEPSIRAEAIADGLGLHDIDLRTIEANKAEACALSDGGYVDLVASYLAKPRN